MSDEPDEVVEEDEEDGAEEEEESPALKAERISKELSNATSPTGPPAEPIAEGSGEQPAEVQDYRNP